MARAGTGSCSGGDAARAEWGRGRPGLAAAARVQFPSPGRGTPGTVASRAAAPTRCAGSYFSEGKGTRSPPLATWWGAVGGGSPPGAAAGSSASQ